HEAFDGIDCVFGIGHRLALGHLPNQPLATLGETHYRRRRPASLLVRYDNRCPRFHDCNDRICGSQVNPNDLTHSVALPFRRFWLSLSLISLCNLSASLSSLVLEDY